MKKPTCTLYGGLRPPYENVHVGSPPYENVHVGFFIHTSRKRKKKSTVNSYNLISYHFHTKSKDKQP